MYNMEKRKLIDWIKKLFIERYKLTANLNDIRIENDDNLYTWEEARNLIIKMVNSTDIQSGNTPLPGSFDVDELQKIRF